MTTPRRALGRCAWLMLITLTAAACGGGSAATTAVQAADSGLSGVHFEVHENPG